MQSLFFSSAWAASASTAAKATEAVIRPAATSRVERIFILVILKKKKVCVALPQLSRLGASFLEGERLRKSSVAS
jgi:hypothetical protein